MKDRDKTASTSLRVPFPSLAMSLLAAALLAAPAVADRTAATRSGPPPGAAELGRQIYELGLLPSGERLTGSLLGDIELSGKQLYCTSCHGRSGHGSTEGSVITPSISGSRLYQTQEINRRELYKSRVVRPAYTDGTLKRAIREGIDANGAIMDEMMPRYDLNDEAADYLIAYLKTLSVEASPGVTDDTIHFATVITDEIGARQRAALLDVLNAFFDSKNATTRQETRRAELAPFHKEWRYQSYRRWSLSVWELRGDAATWMTQLQRHYARQPVFAVVSGIGAGSWEPIHTFCEAQSLPCILPNTRVPVVSESDWYSVYFSKGVALEAAAIVRHLQEAGNESGQILQVASERPVSLAAAAALRSELAAAGMPPPMDITMPAGAALATAPLGEAAGSGSPYTLVIWPDGAAFPDLESLAATGNPPRRIYLSAAELPLEPDAVPNSLRDRLFLTYPYNLPSDSAGRLKRANFWMKQKGIEITDDQLQSNALFTGMLVSQALKHIGSNFQRDYFVEKIEHIMDSMGSLASYPNLSLASSQRYASKGCYIATLSAGDDGGVIVAGDWIVP